MLVAWHPLKNSRFQTLKGAAPDQNKMVELTAKFEAEKVERKKSDVALTTSNERITKLEDDAKETEAKSRVGALITAGKLTPAQREPMVQMAITSPDLFTKLEPTFQVVVPLNERGKLITTPALSAEMSDDQIKAHITEISKLL